MKPKVSYSKRSTKLANIKVDGIRKNRDDSNYKYQKWKWEHYWFCRNKKDNESTMHNHTPTNWITDEMDKFLKTQNLPNLITKE